MRPKMSDPRHVAQRRPSYLEIERSSAGVRRKKWTQIMNVRALLIVPVALVVGVLAGCGGQADTESNTNRGAAQFRLPSTDACHAPAYIRERAPAGLCTDAAVDDFLSPLTGQ
jgi:hypothetical protein